MVLHNVQEKEVQRSSLTPRLSIIVASAWSVTDLHHCLNALLPQIDNRQIADSVEVIVADCSSGMGSNQSLSGLMTGHPHVTLLHFPPATTLPTLWGTGIARATGEIIAITDSTCLVGDNWVQAILKAHESTHSVIGGAVEPAKLGGWVDWAAYFCDYGQFMLPLEAGAVNELPGNNISFKRCTLERGREYVERGFWKTYWCRSLQETGIPLMAEPSIIVSLRKSYHLSPFLRRRFQHGRCFGGMRVAQAPLYQRIFYAAGSVVLPFLFSARIVKAIIPKRRYRREFLFSLPISILAILSWSFGEFCGYVAGAGDSCSYIY